jgi:hypothetical protein
MMQRILFIFLLAVSLVGCSTAQSRRDAALAVWRSPKSGLNQRVEAAEKLLPRGAQVDEIEGLLGKQWHWDRWQLPAADFMDNVRLPDIDCATMEYEFAQGNVTLVLGPRSSNDGFWFASALHKVPTRKP